MSDNQKPAGDDLELSDGDLEQVAGGINPLDMRMGTRLTDKNIDEQEKKLAPSTLPK